MWLKAPYCIPECISFKNNVLQFPLVYYNNLIQWNAKNLLSYKEKNPTQANKDLPVSNYIKYKQNLFKKKLRYLPHCHPGCIELSLCIITSNSQMLVLPQKWNIFKCFSNFNINIPSTMKISDDGTTSQHPTFAQSPICISSQYMFYYQQGP
jgi:hypothetical protein